jgi:hypothetical protein
LLPFGLANCTYVFSQASKWICYIQYQIGQVHLTDKRYRTRRALQID